MARHEECSGVGVRGVAVSWGNSWDRGPSVGRALRRSDTIVSCAYDGCMRVEGHVATGFSAGLPNWAEVTNMFLPDAEERDGHHEALRGRGSEVMGSNVNVPASSGRRCHRFHREREGASRVAAS